MCFNPLLKIRYLRPGNLKIAHMPSALLKEELKLGEMFLL